MGVQESPPADLLCGEPPHPLVQKYYDHICDHTTNYFDAKGSRKGAAGASQTKSGSHAPTMDSDEGGSTL